MSKKVQRSNNESEEVKSIIKGIGWSSFGCGSHPSVVDVEQGKIVRTRPLHYDWKYKPEEFNPWKMKARGKVFEPTMKALIPPFSIAYKKRAYSPNRILYPLKRVDWDPEGDRHPENRGKSSYVRVSWDEALELVAGEIKRIHKEYGTNAILLQADGHGETKTVHGPHGCSTNLLEILGGFTLQARNPDSWEGWYWGAKHVWGMEPIGEMIPRTNIIKDTVENTELILFQGCDPETTTWGWNGQMASRLCYFFTEVGIKSIYICPDLNYGAAVHADKWIPILPNTDAALQLAVAYMWINERTYDKEYVKTHVVGFNKFSDYVTGKEDGVPKTPKWASEKCGVPSRVIKALAREWASKRTSTAHCNGGSYIRGPYSTEPARLEVCLLGMQGLGKPGVHQVQMIEWGFIACPEQQPMPRPLVCPAPWFGYRGWSPVVYQGWAKVKPRQVIPKTLIHDAILKPPLKWYGSTLCTELTTDQFVEYNYPLKGFPEIRMIWTDTPCLITCWNDSNTTMQAYRSPKIEFMLAQHPWLENDCLFADIILPANTLFEEEDILADFYSGQFDTIWVGEKCTEPIGESKSDYEIVCAIAEKLGLLEKFNEGKTIEEWMRVGFDKSGVPEAGLCTWDKLKDKGYYVVPTDPAWDTYKTGMQGFYEKPNENPLSTPTGKLEFYSEKLAKHFPDDNERPPVPKWIEKGLSHDERLSSERAKKYPLLIMSNHGRWRVHANLDDISWFHEIETCKIKGSDGYLYEPVWINSSTAEKKGIENGDIVKVFNERGAVLCGAYVTERIMPGVVYVDHGSRHDPIAPGLDRGGAINTITPHNVTSKNCSGEATSGFLVDIENVDIYKLMKQYPEPFSRPYDTVSGLKFERVLAKGDR